MTISVVVDGNNLVMRALFAMRGGQVALSSHGQNTGPLIVFARMPDRYARFTKPDHLVVCWDSGPSWRKMVDSSYKANRGGNPDGEPPDEVDIEKLDAFGLVRHWLALNNIFTYTQANFEADDLIAGYASQKRNAGDKVWVISGDKDLLQMVEGDAVRQIRPTSGMTPPEEVWNEDRIIAKYGLSRDELTLLNALTGDSSDNIPGLAGIGPKRAATLIKASQGLIETLVDNERCRDHKDRIVTNLILMDLRNPNLRPNLPSLPLFRPTSHESIGWQALQAFIREYQLASLSEMVVGWGGD